MNPQRLLVDWKSLRQMGWPYSRTHTWRMMNEGRFPRAYKLGGHPHSHPVWKYADIVAYLETFNLVLTSKDTAS